VNYIKKPKTGSNNKHQLNDEITQIISTFSLTEASALGRFTIKYE